MPFVKGQARPAGAGRQRKPAAPHLEIVYRPLAWFRPYERNPRKNDGAVDRMCASIAEYGFTIPVLARSTGDVIDGHLRLKAALKLKKFSELPVILCDGWSEAQVKAFRLMVNRSVNWADWDLDALALEFGDLKAFEFDLKLTGFDSREIDQFTLVPNAAEDEVPPVPDAPVTRAGDLWLMGGHRLLCGDATKAQDVGLALSGAKPFLMVTDPPYGVSYDPEWRLRSGVNKPWQKRSEGLVINDERADWSQAWVLAPVTVVYVWHSALHSSEVAHSLTVNGFEIRSQIIWSKKSLVIGRGHYHWQHEPCWYASKGNAHWKADRKQSTVWATENMHATQGNVDDGKTNHSTQKPVEIMRRPILNHTAKGESVYDPFLGSGTTLIAAELTDRRCYGLEIDSGYCDVIVTRWENLTGRKATLEGHAGLTFDQVKAGRLLEAQDAIKEETEEAAAV